MEQKVKNSVQKLPEDDLYGWSPESSISSTESNLSGDSSRTETPIAFWNGCKNQQEIDEKEEKEKDNEGKSKKRKVGRSETAPAPNINHCSAKIPVQSQP